MNISIINWRRISAVLLAILVLLGVFLLGPWGPTGSTEAGDLNGGYNGYTYITPP